MVVGTWNQCAYILMNDQFKNNSFTIHIMRKGEEEYSFYSPFWY